MESEHTKQGLSIGVHAAQEVVYAEVGHDDGEEGQHHHQVVSAGTLKGGKRLGVQGNGIDEEGDEGPRLLWIPSPVVAPAHVGPDGADEDAHAEGGDGRIEEVARQGLQFTIMRGEGKTGDAALSVFFPSMILKRVS